MTERGPLPGFLSPLSWIAARFYGLGERVSSHRMTSRVPVHLPVPVVSIGNLTAGGTGKTPLTARLAEALQQAGRRPAIALRGYRSDATGGSDEAAEYRARLSDIPILVGVDRAGSALSMLESNPGSFDILLLDDGFQHRRLHRDLDILLVDASRPGLDGDLLPRGWLREPASRIQRADLVVVTNSGPAESEPLVADAINRYRGSGPDVWSCHAWSRIDVYVRGELVQSVVDPLELSCRKVSIVSGLGNPVAFEEHVRAAGFEVLSHRALRDHASYDSRELDRISGLARQSEGLLVPAKDWVKLKETKLVVTEDVPILVPRVHIEFLQGGGVLEQALSAACGTTIAL